MQNQGLFTGSPRSRGMMLLVASCALVATGSLLGMEWLRTPVAGVSTGIWIVALVQIQAWLLRRVRMSASESLHQVSIPEPEVAERSGFLGRVLAMVWESIRVLARSLRVPRDWFREAEDRISIRMDRVVREGTALRIGLDAGPEFRGAITSAATELDVEWVVLSPSTDDQATLRRHRLDALVRAAATTPARPVRIATLEHPEREAAWFDWGTSRPLTYLSVFPVSVDVCQVTLEDCELDTPAQAALVASLLRASAALSRSAGRLRLSDRLCGRVPSAGGGHGVRTPTSLLDRAMLELTAAVIEHSASRTAAARAAGRVASAWLASTEAWLDINLRRKGVEAAFASCTGESEVMLRAGAIRLAMCEDDAAFAAFKDAERAIRSGSHQQIGEHLTFLQAELELGLPSPLTLGRVAAGVCLVCASSPADRAAFIRGDIMDDVRHSAWLHGRDQDREVLGEVFKLMGADLVQPGPWELRDAA